MDQNIAAIITQLTREVERAHKFSLSDPALDWKAWSSAKATLIAVAPLLPPEVGGLVMRLVGKVEEAYLSEL